MYIFYIFVYRCTVFYRYSMEIIPVKMIYCIVAVGELFVYFLILFSKTFTFLWDCFPNLLSIYL